MPPASERRRFPRRSVSLFGVEIQGSNRYMRRIRDLSEGGFHIDRPFEDNPVGERLDVIVELLGSRDLRAQVEVAHNPGDGSVGVRFVTLRAPDAERLSLYLGAPGST